MQIPLLAHITPASFPAMSTSKLAAYDSAADVPAAYDAATRWLYDRIDYERLARSGSRYRFTLDRMRDLVTRLGHAQYLCRSDRDQSSQNQTSVRETAGPRTVGSSTKARIVHVAGTKGKGSVATMTATMLAAAGHRVGLYTSPHLVDLEERFRVNGSPASRRQMTELVDSMRTVVDAMSCESIGGPSFFELTTAIAIEHFHRCECDYWVLETGLGGRLDSTNVFQSEVTLLTSIGLDHQHVLGDTVELIAKEKAGILKPNVPAISSVRRPAAREVIRHRAAEVGAPLLELGRDFQLKILADEATGQGTPAAQWGNAFELVRENSNETLTSPTVRVRLKLEGEHQASNAAIALMGVDQLGVSLSDAVLDALAHVQIEARLERFDLPHAGTVILDAAHNPDSITALVEVIKKRFAGRKIIGVFGTSVDKDGATMLDLLGDCLDNVVLTRYHGNPRFVPVETLAELARKASSTNALAKDWFTINEDPLAACQTAMEQAGRDGIVIICGSFFLAAEVRPWLVTQRT